MPLSVDRPTIFEQQEDPGVDLNALRDFGKTAQPATQQPSQPAQTPVQQQAPDTDGVSPDALRQFGGDQSATGRPSELFYHPGTEQRQRDYINVVDPSTISPFDFTKDAIGTPWRTGAGVKLATVGAQVGEMFADLRDGINGRLVRKVEDSVPDPLADYIRFMHRGALNKGAEKLRQYAGSVKTRPSNLSDVDEWKDWFRVNPDTGMIRFLEPNRAYVAIAEGLPLAASLLLAYAANPKLGFLAMSAVEGSDVHANMKHYEETTGEEIPLAYKIGAVATVGSFNAWLERFQMERYMRLARAQGNPSFGKHLMNVAFASANNALITGTQAITQEAAKVPYTGVLPDSWGSTFMEGFHGGFFVGGAMGAGSSIMGQIKHRSPDDTQLTFVKNEKGDLEPQFRVTKGGHPLEGQSIGLAQAMEAADIQLPLWRREKLKTQIVDALPKEDFLDVKVEEVMVLLDAHASQLGYKNADRYIKEHNIIVKEGTRIEPGDLLQVETFHGTIYDFARFDTAFIGTGEGVQVFGWGMYQTEGRGIAENQYARKLAQEARENANMIYRGKQYPNQVDFVSQIAKEAGIDTTTLEMLLHDGHYDTYINFQESVIDAITTLQHESLREDGTINRNLFDMVLQEIMEAHLEADATFQQQMESTSMHQFQADVVSEGSAIQSDVTLRVLQHLQAEHLEGARPPLPEPIVYEVTIHPGKDPADYKFLPWRDNISTTNLLSVESKLAEISETTDFTSIKNLLTDKTVDAALRYRAISDIQQRADRAMERIDDLLLAQSNRVTGAHIYNVLATEFGSAEMASRILWDAGFSGTIYKADGGTSEYNNYVVFDTSIMRIDRKYNPDELLQIKDKSARGAVSFNTKDGETVLKFFKDADISTALHEMAHIFRRGLRGDMLAQAEQAFKVKDGEWAREHEEAFARGFELWLHDGGPSSHKNATLFQRFKNWLTEIYARSVHTLGEKLSDEHVAFFESMFDLTIAEINRTPQGYQQTSVLGHHFDSFFDWFGVESRFDRIGMGETGFHLKNFFSAQSVYQHEGEGVVKNMSRAVKQNKKKDVDAVLLSEDAVAMEAIREKAPEERTDVENAALHMRDYFDHSQEEYVGRGIRINFKERLLGDLQERLEHAQEKGEPEAIQNLIEKIQEAEGIEYVHIPVMFWVRNMIETKPQQANKVFVQLLAPKRKRETLRISDLIEDGVISREDVRSRDIVASYARQKGRDFALMNIRQAAYADGAIVPEITGKKPPGFRTAPPHMRIFKDFYMHDTLYNWVNTQMAPVPYSALSWARKWINITKMWAFWNPLFLPMYDITQAHMAGAMNVLRPFRTHKQFSKALQDVLDMSPDFMLAQNNGIASVPFNNPLEQIGSQFDVAARTRHHAHHGNVKKMASYALAHGEHAFADFIEKTIAHRSGMEFLKQFGGIRPLVRNAYEASWNTAWFLDRTVRQVTYNHFIEKGYTPRDAAQSAALAHGDYASVPPRSRRALNTILFTPTFKIAMGKWAADSFRSIGNVLAGEATLNQRQKASVMIRTIGILTAFDMLMLGFDFERDDFGRRYFKKVDTPTGQREMVVNWTGPFNLFLKYMQRTKEAFGPEVANPMMRMYQQNSWEVTPLIRIFGSIFSNKTPGNERIWFVGDDTATKVAKATTYFSTSSLAALQQLIGEDDFGKDGAEAFAREYGQGIQVLTAPFVFKYTRQTYDIRTAQKIEAILRIHEEEVEASRLMTEIFRRGRDPMEVVQAYVDGTGMWRTPLEKRSENLVRRLQKIIDEYEEENYNMWAPDTRYMHRSDPVEDSSPDSGVSPEDLMNFGRQQ